MAHIEEKEFFDEYDNTTEIARTIKKERYSRAFEFLHRHFNDTHHQWITATVLQENLCIPDHSNAYQILESFRILNLLSKQINPKNKNRAYYTIINKEYWEYGEKELEKWMLKKK